MLFNSYIFIFLFLPVTLLGFYRLKKKQATLAKVWLTCFSFWFYGYFHLNYLLIMTASIAGNYIFHREIVKRRKEGKKKTTEILLITGITINLLVLFYFKYYDFFLENVNLLFDTDFMLKGILLPLGISFFTFQQISFLADTYRGEMDGCSFLDYALFVSFFPQLIAGPIVTHEEMMPQFERLQRKENEASGRDEEKKDFMEKAIYIFVLGLGKKVLLADTFGIAVDYGYANISSLNGLESLLEIIFYSFQLYFDFSGYCDMARGIAGMFGMTISSNFESPYKAGNIVEFWKRWHITLSRFFTKNIYIPLGGNKKGRIRTYLHFIIVFFLSGLWHGAGWNFILWGMMHGILYVVTKIYLEGRKEKVHRIRKVLGVLFTFSYISVAWVYFRAGSIAEANQLLTNLWTKPWALPGEMFMDGFNLGELWYPMKILKITELPYADSYAMFGFLMISAVIIFFGKNITGLSRSFKPTLWNACFTAVLFLWCVISLSGVSTFLYFNF